MREGARALRETGIHVSQESNNTIIEHHPYARYCAQHFTHGISFNSHNPVRKNGPIATITHEEMFIRSSSIYRVTHFTDKEMEVQKD